MTAAQSTGGGQRKMVPVSRHWMECTEPDNVTKYFYNISTGESSWIEPEEVRRCVKSLEQLGEMVEKEERGKQVLRTVDQSAWQERRDATGKPYYFNTVTKASVWEMPAELREWRQAVEPDQGEEQRERREKEFMKMLEEKGVGVAWTWEDCLKEVIGHPSYKCLPTLADRKACFIKYIDDLRHKKSREGKRTDPRDDFIDALMSLRVTRTCRYTDVEERLRRLECYSRLSSRERLDLFEQHIKQLNKQYRQAITDEVVDFLYSSRYEFGRVGWLDVKRTLTERFPQVSPMDLLSAWQHFILDCEERAIQQAHRERDELMARRKQCSLQFRHFLTRLHEQGKLDHQSTYKNLKPIFMADSPDYTTLNRINPDLSIIIFLNYLDALEDEYEKDSKFLEQLQSKQLPLDDYYGCLTVINPSLLDRNHQSAKTMEETKDDKTICDMQTVQNQQTTEDEKDRFRPEIDKYKQLLKHLNPPIRLSSDYRDYEPLLRKHPEHQALPTHLQREYFEKYQLYLKRKHPVDGGVDGNAKKIVKY